MRTVPYFLDTFPAGKRPTYAKPRGDIRTAVAIVGGGITGCACAAAFAAAGIRVVLLEADRIGGQATAASAGLVRQDLDASFHAGAAQHGLRTARHVWQAFRRASLDFSAALRRLQIRADLRPQGVLLFSRDGADRTRVLQREYQARRDAGLDVSWLTPRAASTAAAVAVAGAIRTPGDAIDPYRACLGLAAAAVRARAQVHEHTTVRRVRAGKKTVEIRTDGGVITADAVIMASGAPIDDVRALRRHFAPTESYAVVTEALPAAVRREIGTRASALRDDDVPPHLLRWLKDDRVLFCGADQPPTAVRLREKTVIQRSNRLMYELSTLYPAISGVQAEWAWSVTNHGSPDGLPVIGPHRNFPRHLFALGSGSHGPGVAWLAARVLLREYLGEPDKGDDLFGFARVL